MKDQPTLRSSIRNAAQATLETLEKRQLLAFTASLEDGVLMLRGDGQSDTAVVEYNRFTQRLEVTRGSAFSGNPPVFTTPRSGVTRIDSDLGNGRNTLSINLNEMPGVPIPIIAQGGEDRDTMRVSGVGAGPATLRGNGGDDVLNGGDYNDQLFGGDGNDNLTAGNGSDSLFGEAGDDSLFGSSIAGSRATLSGGIGDDFLRPRSGDIAEGGAGDDEFETFGAATALGQDGNDTFLIRDPEIASIAGGNGNDTFTVELSDDVNYPTDGSFQALGYSILQGQAGDDTFILPGGGREDVSGGSGNDRLDIRRDPAYLNTAPTFDNVANDGPNGDNFRSDIETSIRGTQGVSASFNNGVLTVNGSDFGEEIILTSNPSNGELFVFVRPDGSSPQNSVFRSGPVSNLVSIVLNLNGGDDSISVGSLQASGYTFIVNAGAGDDRINLEGLRGHTASTVRGGAGNDTLTTSAQGNDELLGEAGDDFLSSTNAGPKDILRGGDGDDTLFGLGNHEAFGDAGNDRFTANFTGNPTGTVTTLRGGDGNDTLYDLRGSIIAYGDGGDDSFRQETGTSTLYGGDGNDTLQVAGGLADGGAGDDTLSNNGFGGGVATLLGGAGDDDITVFRGNNLADGGDGNDTITVASNNTQADAERITLIGGNGDDTITTDLGRRASRFITVQGGAGNDYIFNGASTDDISGGSGVDIVEYTNRAGTVTVTRDNVANDGVSGENDNVRSDVESVFNADNADADAPGAPSVIVSEVFDEQRPDLSTPVTSGQLSDGTPWTITSPGGPFSFEAGGTLRSTGTAGAIATWQTQGINISGGPVQIRFEDASIRVVPGELVDFQYRLDGGAWTSYARLVGRGGELPEPVTSPTLNGQTLELRIRVLLAETRGDSGTTGSFTVDNLRILRNPISTPTQTIEQPLAPVERIGDTLVISGTDAADNIRITPDLSVFFNGVNTPYQTDGSPIDSLRIFALGGNDTITVEKGVGPDVYALAGLGDDTINMLDRGFVRGHLGNDRITAGDVRIIQAFGDAGNDTLDTGTADYNEGTFFDDPFFDDDGDDLILLNTSIRHTSFGSGNDTFRIAPGVDVNIFSGAGDDTYLTPNGPAAAIVINDGDGSNFPIVDRDRVDVAATGSVDIVTGSGDDNVRVRAGTASINVGDGIDTVETYGGGNQFFVTLGNGDDVVTIGENTGGDYTGDGGNDKFITAGPFAYDRQGTMLGGDGDDTLVSGTGSDIFFGGAGSNTIDYSARTDSGPFNATDDGIANDGAPGEGDSVGQFSTVLLPGDTPTNPAVTIVSEPFDEANGATSGNLNGNTSAQWKTFRGGLGSGFFAVQNGQLRVSNTAGFVSWYTTDINIAGNGAVDLSLDLTGTNIGPDDLARFLYRVDNGPLQQFAFTRGQSGNLTATASGITGNSLKVEVQFQAKQGAFTLDNLALKTQGSASPVVVDGDTIRVTGTDGADTITHLSTDGHVIEINGQAFGPYDVNTVTKLVIDAKGGDDLVSVDRFISATVNGGAGDDTIGALVDTLGTGGIGGFVDLRGGAGNDALRASISDGSARLDGGDGDDQITAITGGNGTSATVIGGAGNDLIDTQGDTGSAPNTQINIDGGSGNDTLLSGSGADDFTGGPGNDTVDYRGRSDGPFAVTFDNVANDGADGEGDNIRSDVENALGTGNSGGEPDTLYAEPFDDGDGATSGNLTGGGQWRTFRGGLGSGDFRVINGGLFVGGTSGFVSWYTTPLDIAGDGPVDIALTLSASDLGPDDLARFVYRVDGGPAQQFAFVRGASGNGVLQATASGITGSSLQVEVQFQAKAGRFVLDNFSVDTLGDGNGGGNNGGDDLLTEETFDEPNGATAGTFANTTTGPVATWSTFRGGANFSVQNGVFRATNTDGFRSWYTNRFDISGQSGVDLAVDLASFGNVSAADRLNVFYRIDGGAAVALGTFRGGVNQTLSVAGLTGSTLQIEIQANVASTTGGYTWDNVRVS